jgi:methylated-DNA-[protein]-cysteine S-methyltransferase
MLSLIRLSDIVIEKKRQKMKEHSYYYQYKNGFLEIIFNDTELNQINFVAKAGRNSENIPTYISNTIKELDEYFEGARKNFTIPQIKQGTKFQQEVWKSLTQIPYGKTKTYGEIAAELGRPGAARAVGGACHDNPFPILIPCHRVVGKDGKLTGFGGGLDTKKWLLALESDVK